LWFVEHTPSRVFRSNVLLATTTGESDRMRPLPDPPFCCY
jgi:hypothetical protein